MRHAKSHPNQSIEDMVLPKDFQSRIHMFNVSESHLGK